MFVVGVWYAAAAAVTLVDIPLVVDGVSERLLITSDQARNHTGIVNSFCDRLGLGFEVR